MRQLSGSDAYHVLEETPAQHMHTMKIVIVDAPRATEPITYDGVRRWAADHLPRVPPLRWQVVPMPLGLARPAWIEAPKLDVDYHVRHLVLESPGSPEQFDDAVSGIASVALDREKPLWQLWFIEGLEGGRAAFAFKMHHSIADGMASVRVLEEAFGALDLPADVPAAEPVPSRLRLLGFALRSQVRTWAGLPKMLRRTLASLRAGRAREKAGGAAVTRPMTGPSTRFNRPLSAERIYVDVTIPLSDLRAVKDALGATLNDVFIAVCGGALRRYLEKQGELPDGDLTGTSPVSLRTDDELSAYGNRTSYWYVTLAPGTDDAAGRLARISASTSAARDWAQGDRSLFSDWQNHYILFRMFSVKMLAMAEKRMGKPAFNAIVSNVRGPGPLSFQGAPVVSVRSMGPIVGSEGINFTGWSYGDEMSIGIHACRGVAPDLREMAAHVVAELDELKEAARAR